MKKLILLLLMWPALHEIKAFAGPEDENRLVTALLEEMVKPSENRGDLHRFIAPSFYITHDISKFDHTVNTYSPEGYDLEENKGYGIVTALIWGSEKSWIHRLTFKVVEENKNFYLLPGKAPEDIKYIDPWYKAETFVSVENKGSLAKYSSAETLIKDLCYDMTYNNTDFGKNAMKYIAPSYFKNNYLRQDEYSVNSYYPKGYSYIGKQSNGIYLAEIWGENRSWVNELYFDVVYENGSYYLYPGGHTTNNYVHPWKEVKTGQTETKTTGNESSLVLDIIDDMIAGNVSDMHRYIAPSFYTTEKISKYDYNVNYYSPVGGKIIEERGNGIIIARVWGKDKGWTHELWFKVVKESGKYYLMPDGYTTTNYIHPWYSVTENADLKYYSVNEGSKIVDELLFRMCYNKDEYSNDMRLYIAPSYFKMNSLNPFDYLVNSYSPHGYSIERSIDGLVVAKIWGSNKSWVHELNFKIVTENGLTYLMPGKHYSGTKYVDPWYSMKTGAN